jgi:predicted O-linked N-acetylglucosamine transferase (SPINDLY family)
MTTSLYPSPKRSAPPVVSPRQRRAAQAWQEGLRWTQKGQHGQASQAFQRAVGDAPTDAAYWLHLARSELHLGHLASSHEAALQALQHADLTTWAMTQCLVILFQQVQDHAAVLQALDGHAAGQVQQDMGAAWQIERANALTELRRPDAALECGMQALMHSMQGADAGNPENRALRRRAALLNGHNLASLKRHAEAAICYRMAVDAEPLSVGCALYAAHYSAWTCDWTQLGQDLDRLQDAVLAVDALPAGSVHEDLSPFSLIGLSDDPVLMRWAAEHANPLMAARHRPAPRPTGPVARPGGRLRIGLLSSDFYMHATAILIAEMLEGVDRERFELFFYDNSPDDGSAMRARLFQCATQVHSIFDWSDSKVVAQVRADQIGVLVDLKGFTNGARMGVLAARPAPVQVAWLGYPGTCGNPAIDYQIGDPVVTPLAHQDDFTECIAQLPCCYQPNDSSRSLPPTWSRADCELPQDAVVLASFNQAYKTTEPVFTAWCEVLRAVPHAVLWLLVKDDLTQQRLRHHATTLGVAPERLIFAPYVDAESHRARIGQADLVLDTFPCGGHTTTSDLLWAGVPVLTLCGRTFAARVAASLLTHLGLPELVCDSLDQYRDQAIALCHEAGALARLRQSVARGKQDSGLFDGKRFAGHWQDLIERMVARQNAGLPPAPLAAPT